MRDVTLKQLRTLGAVAKMGSISRAAQALSLTPPAISIQMRLLEDAIGLPLTERLNRTLRLTGAGEALLAAAHRIDAALEDCRAGLNSMRGLKGGRVAVGVVSTAKYMAPYALGAFARIHPDIDLNLSVGNREETISGLKNYSSDLVIMGRPPDDVAVDKALIGDHPHIIIAPTSHPLARRRRIAPEALGSETFLVREVGSGTRLLMETFLKSSQVNPKIGMEMSSNETIKQAVIAGMGIAFISAHTVASELQLGRLVSLPVAGLPVLRQWYVVKRSDRRFLPVVESLWTFLSTQGGRFLPTIPPARR